MITSQARPQIPTQLPLHHLQVKRGVLKGQMVLYSYLAAGLLLGGATDILCLSLRLLVPAAACIIAKLGCLVQRGAVAALRRAPTVARGTRAGAVAAARGVAVAARHVRSGAAVAGKHAAVAGGHAVRVAHHTAVHVGRGAAFAGHHLGRAAGHVARHVGQAAAGAGRALAAGAGAWVACWPKLPTAAIATRLRYLKRWQRHHRD
jgi:hypothetical protein